MVFAESLYIGGVDNDMYSSKLPKNLYSRNGYEGCFGSFVVNNKLINLMSNRMYRRPVDGTILQGCQGELLSVDLHHTHISSSWQQSNL